MAAPSPTFVGLEYGQLDKSIEIVGYHDKVRMYDLYVVNVSSSQRLS